MRSLTKILGSAALVATVATATTACTPDTTRGRVEHDIGPSFANAYALSEQLQGHQAVKPKISSTECHSSVNTKEDSGPGSWDCEVSYQVNGAKKDVSLVVLIDQLGCYQAMDGDHRDRQIVTKQTGAKMPDPKVGFDGCYNVYDGRTNVAKK